MSIRSSLIAFTSAVLTAVSALAAPQVAVTGGTVQGTTANGIDAFKGIPFAAPPVGALRWRAPQPVAPWQGVYDASRDRADCAQVKFSSKVAPLGDVGLSEDCLYLDVWRPEGAKKAPVMVWLHGGGFVNGGISPKTFDGKYFAHKGVVLVSVNYRLGRFGFFAFPGLTQENPDEPKGNYGLMDQIAALKWVKANIAQFGGDPDNVTIFGESAGGGSVHAMLASPMAQGLFHKAIIQSGGGRALLMGDRLLSKDQPGLPSLETIGANFAEVNAITGTDTAALAKLRALPAETLVGTLNMMKIDEKTYGGPTIDGKLVVESPQSAYEAGRQAKVPLMIGATNADLGRLHPANLEEALRPFGDAQDEARKAYDPDNTGNLNLIVARMGADQMMIEPARFTAREFSKQALPVYEYRFSYVAKADVADQKNGPRAKAIANKGAQHASDVPYAFDTISGVLGDMIVQPDAIMAYTMSTYWANFAKTGNPNGAGLPNWPAYDANADVLMNFTATGEAKAMPDPWKVRLDLTEKSVSEK
jgi:para-nitrobenzyl esterase